MVTPEQHELLQRYLDGDLAETDRADLEGQLANDRSLSEELQVLRRLHTLIVDAGEYQASQLDSEALFARISAAVEPALVATPAAAAAQTPGFFERLLRGGFWMPAGGALAVMAALLLTVYLPVDHTRLDDRANPAAKPAASDELAAGAEQQDIAAVLPAPSSEVVQVDFGSNAGTVFEIALADGASTPVVWINDEEE